MAFCINNKATWVLALAYLSIDESVQSSNKMPRVHQMFFCCISVPFSTGLIHSYRLGLNQRDVVVDRTLGPVSTGMGDPVCWRRCNQPSKSTQPGRLRWVDVMSTWVRWAVWSKWAHHAVKYTVIYLSVCLVQDTKREH